MQATGSDRLDYRPEVDGLRALAVLAVLIYHADIMLGNSRLFPGGFAGVDVFFVISGYLITRIIYIEALEQKFSYNTFYERRIRRILPALFVMQAACIPFALVYFLPRDLIEFAGSLVSSTLFFSNIFFSLQDSYFAADASLKPLLHTWSLGIEEQFYIIFPILLMLSLKLFPKRLFWVFSLILLASLFAAEYSWRNSMDKMEFYWIHTRFWELMFGSLCAIYEINKGRKFHRLLHTLLPILGVIFIVFSYIEFTASLPYPSLITTFPVLGTVFIILFAKRGGLITTVLCSRLVVLIGLISYSLYLWHQPVFAYANLLTQGEMNNLLRMVLMLVSIVLAILSYKYIERPFRNRHLFTTRLVFVSMFLTGMALVAIGSWLYFSDGLITRYPPMVQQVLKQEITTGRLEGVELHNCGDDCSYISMAVNPEANNHILVAGDSHAAVLTAALQQFSTNSKMIISFARGGCPYQTTFKVIRRNGTVNCAPKTIKVTRDIGLQFEPAITFITARLPLYLEPYDEQKADSHLQVGFITKGGQWPNFAEFEEVKQAIISEIQNLLEKGRKVVLIYPVPESEISVPWQLISIVRSTPSHLVEKRLKDQPYTLSLQAYQNTSSQAYEIYDAIGEHENLLRIYPTEILCDDSVCYTHSDAGVYYIDGDHLSGVAARMLIDHAQEKILEKWNIRL